MSTYKSDIRIIAKILGEEYPVVAFSDDWALNTIPQATCVLAVGREAFGGEKAAKTHEFNAAIRRMEKVYIYFQGQGQYDKDNDWPDKRVLIFEGRLANVGPATDVGGKMYVTLQIVHWLIDLTFGSALASQYHPTNPLDYSFAAILSYAPTGGVADRAVGIGATSAGAFLNGLDIATDLWARVLKRLLCGLASAPQIEYRGALALCAGLDTNTVNQNTLRALARIYGEIGDCKSDRPCFVPKLSLGAMGQAPTDVVNAVYNAISQDMVSSFAQQSIWGKLVGTYAPAFLFSVVPMVTGAAVVPYIPVLNKYYCKEITVNHQSAKQLQNVIQRPIRAMAISAALKANSGVVSSADRNLTGIGGCYAPPDPDPNGEVRVLRAPPWFDNVAVTAYSPKKSTGIGKKKPSNSAVTPRAYDPDLRGSRNDSTQAQLLASTSQLFGEYAHAMYAYEVLRGRTGNIFTNLRWDIAPGSIVKITSLGEPFIVNDKLAQTIIGAVTIVSHTLNAESRQAGTSFQIEHYRTLAENEAEETSVDRHPLFDTIFRGAPLTTDLEFGSCCDNPKLINP